MIELKNVTKSYNGKAVFSDVNLILGDGRVTAFVGHNGCGKSTMLKVVAGLVTKDSGSIIYDKKYRFAYVLEKFPPINMTARSYLKHIVEIDRIYEKGEGINKIEELSKDFFVEGMIDKHMKTLSKGTLQKIGVIQALLSNANVLLLDEPLSGQDIKSQEVFVEKINQIKRKGTIILLSAHEPDLIKSIGDEVYTIKESRLISYEIKPRTRYVIEVQDDKSFFYTDEQMLHLEIKRLQKEGRHIRKIYEEDKRD